MRSDRRGRIRAWLVALTLAGCGGAHVASPAPSQPARPPLASAAATATATDRSPPDPCLNHHRAIAEANDGDALLQTDVDGAIAQYVRARELDPDNHAIVWKLACAYDRKGDWESMIVAAERAAALAPDHANYWFKTGYAMVKQAEAGHPEFYQRAKAPLERCLRADPNHAEAYYFLGEARLWTDDEQGAIEAYSQAIEHDSKVAYFYAPLADLYISLKLYRDAEQVLKEGLSAITPSDATAEQLYAMYLMRFRIAQAANDKPNMVGAMEKAFEVSSNAHPEIAFNLGSTYAVMKPPRKADAVRLLGLFYKLACRGAGAAKFALQCEEANELIQRLGQ